MRKSLALGLATVSLTGVGALVPAAANAACTPPAGGGCADTVLTVNLSGGSLSITAPGTASLSGSSAPGTVIGPTAMGATATSVTDSRGTLAGWSVTAATSGDLVSTSAPTHKITLGATGPLVLANPSVNATGLASLTGVGAGSGGALNSTTPVTVATALSLGGAGTYTFTPTLTLTVPANTYAASDYTTTITQSVQ